MRRYICLFIWYEYLYIHTHMDWSQRNLSYLWNVWLNAKLQRNVYVLRTYRIHNDLVSIDGTDSATVNALTLHATDCWQWIYWKILDKRSNVWRRVHIREDFSRIKKKIVEPWAGYLEVRIRTWSILSAVSRRAGGPSRRHVGYREYFVSDVLVTNFLGDCWVRRVSERSESEVERE